MSCPATIQEFFRYFKNGDMFLAKRELKYLYQKFTRGWDDSDLWSLDYTISKFALPRLIEFRKNQCGIPYGLTEEEWLEILDKIIFAMDLNIKELGDYWHCISKEEEKLIDEGFELFGKYYRSLWN